MMKQRIYLVDDDEAVRISLSLLLETMGWQVSSYASAADFLATALPVSSGCLLLDIRMPGKSGLVLLEELKQLGVDLPVVVMTGHGNVELCRRAFKNGASEFLTKPVDADLLIEAVGAALDQHQRLWQQQQEKAVLRERFLTLSPREGEVVRLVMQGKTNKEIARDLSLSPRTVETHRANLFTKLEVQSLAQLINNYAVFSTLGQMTR